MKRAKLSLIGVCSSLRQECRSSLSDRRYIRPLWRRVYDRRTSIVPADSSRRSIAKTEASSSQKVARYRRERRPKGSEKAPE